MAGRPADLLNILISFSLCVLFYALSCFISFGSLRYWFMLMIPGGSGEFGDSDMRMRTLRQDTQCSSGRGGTLV